MSPQIFTGSDGCSSTAETAKEIKTLLQQLRKSSNQRQRLLKRNKSSASFAATLSKETEREDALRLDKLRRIFTRLVGSGELSSSGESSNSGEVVGDASSKWKSWLSQQHDVFISHLVDGVVLGRTTALRCFCGVIASTPVPVTGIAYGDDGRDKKKVMLSERLLGRLLEALVKSRGCFENSFPQNYSEEEVDETNVENERIAEEALLTLFESEFIRPYRDAQYFVLKGLIQIASALYGKLEQTRKNLGTSPKTASEQSPDTETNAQVSKIEMNVGLVAENACRILLMIDYVAKKKDDLQDETKFLFTPPVLTEDSGADDDEKFHDDASVDSEADSHITELSNEREENDGKAGSKRLSSSNPSNKGAKRAKTDSKLQKMISWQQSYKHRNALQEAWLSALRLPNLPSRTQKLVLQHLSTYVLGVCPSPLRFAEYFTQSFKGGTAVGKNNAAGTNIGGITAILSLHGLFILMLHHKLEYPQFYTSLYHLLHPRILYTKYRTRFLRLLSKSLVGNSMLPAYVVASFCKRLCRLALAGPPSGGLFALALTSNLLRKHGECACLIHRSGNAEDGLMEDVFVEDVDNLAQTRGEYHLVMSIISLLYLITHICFKNRISARVIPMGTVSS